MRVLLRRTDLRRRLIPALIVGALLLLVLIAGYTYLSYQRATSELVIERDQQLAFLSAARLRDELSKFSDELNTVARSPDVTLGEPKSQQAALGRAHNRLIVFDGGVVLLDNFGRVQAAQPERPEILHQDWADRDYFRRLLASSTPYFSDIVKDGPDNADVIVMSVPIVGSGGELVGVLAGMFRIGEQTTSSFYASVVRMRLGQSGNTYLLDGAGTILYDSAYSATGSAIQERGLPYSISNGELNALRTRDEVGNDIVAAYAPVPGTRWMLVTEDDWASLAGAVQRYGRNLLLLLGMGLLLPPIGVALLIRQQHADMLERQNAEQEKRVAGMVQELVIPRLRPTLPGWDLAFYHQQSVTGERDFYDVWFRPDGDLMLMLGQVNDRGLQAAHIISSTRAVLRGATYRNLSPSEVLSCSNELLAPEVDADTALLCLYAVLSPDSGRLAFAVSGSPWPCFCQDGEPDESHLSNVHLGASLATQFCEVEAVIDPGDCAVLFSDGLSEASNADGELFGRQRIQSATQEPSDDAHDVVEALLTSLHAFTGRSREDQADDITIIVLKRLAQSTESKGLASSADSRVPGNNGGRQRAATT